jgi:hypothetical protein
MEVLAHRQPDERPHRCLDRRARDLTVPLRGVAIADREERPGVKDGEKQRRAGNQVARVHVAAVKVGRNRRERAGLRGDPELAAERSEWQVDSRPELDAIRSRSELSDLQVAIGKVVGQQPEAGDRGRPAPVSVGEVEQVDLERVARLGPGDGDGTGDLVDPVEVESRERLGRGFGRDLAVRGVEAVEIDHVAGADARHRRDGGVPCQVVLVARHVDARCRRRHAPHCVRRRKGPPDG